MANDDLIGSDRPLSRERRIRLDLVLDLIVPPSADGRMPGASEVGVPAYLAAHAPDALAAIEAALDALEAQSHARLGSGFANLDADARRDLVDAVRAADPTFLQRLAQITVACYYQHDRVLAGLGLEPRPPYPKGYSVVSGDLALVEPVQARGKLYRDA